MVTYFYFTVKRAILFSYSSNSKSSQPKKRIICSIKSDDDIKKEKYFRFVCKKTCPITNCLCNCCNVTYILVWVILIIYLMEIRILLLNSKYTKSQKRGPLMSFFKANGLKCVCKDQNCTESCSSSIMP